MNRRNRKKGKYGNSDFKPQLSRRKVVLKKAGEPEIEKIQIENVSDALESVEMVQDTVSDGKEETVVTEREPVLTKKELKKQKKEAKKAARKAEKHRGLKISGLILLTLIAIVVLLAFFAARWVLTYWDGLTMEELLFTATNTTEGTEEGIIIDGIKGIGIPIAITIVTFIVLDVLAIKKKHYLLLAGAYLISSLGFGFYTKNYVYDKLDVEEYLEESNTESEFIKDNYVDPSTVEITFPEEKRNLIYIFSESMEVAYSDTENGGAFEDNYIPELTKLAETYEDFSGSESTLNGAFSTTCATWTMAGMFAQTSGLPLKTNIGNNHMDDMESFFPGITTLGDILEANGYHNEFLCGSDASFGGRLLYYTTHGNYTIDDYYNAITEGYIASWYKVWWGYEDEILFQRAKDKITALAESDEPFNFTLLTVDTHKENGYVCNLCDWEYDDQYANVIACSSKQITEFVSWCQEQDWYDNTTIIISGDHPTMDSDFCENVSATYDRKVYTCYINTAAEVSDPTKKREFCTMDEFPTAIAALGATIDGNRLGMGTNLFSEEETLVEKYGIDRINTEISHKSAFMEELADIDWDSEALIDEEGEPAAYVEEFDYDEEGQSAYIRVGEFEGVGTFFESCVVQLTNDEGITEIFPLELVDDDSETIYEGNLDLKDFYVEGEDTPQYDCAVVVTTKKGKKYRVIETTSESINKPYSNLGNFFDWVYEHPNYVLFGAVKGDASFDVDIHTAYNRDKLGFNDISGDTDDIEDMSWYGIYNNGDIIQDQGFKYLTTSGTITADGAWYYVISAATYRGNVAAIYINGTNYALNKKGYNFVVYDTETHQVVDTVVFKGLMYKVN